MVAVTISAKTGDIPWDKVNKVNVDEFLDGNGDSTDLDEIYPALKKASFEEVVDSIPDKFAQLFEVMQVVMEYSGEKAVAQAKEISELEQTCDEYDANIDKLNEDRMKLKSQLDMMQDEAVASAVGGDTTKVLRQKAVDLESQVERLKKSTQELEDSLAREKQVNEEMDRQMRDDRTKLDKFESENRKLKAELEDIEIKYKRELDAEDNRNKAFRNQQSELAAKQDQINKILNEYKLFKKQNDDLIKQVDELQGKFTEAQEQIKALEDAAGENEFAAKETAIYLTELEGRNSALTEKNKELQIDLMSREKEDENQLDVVEKRIKQAKEEVAKRDKEINLLKAQLKAEKKENETLRDQTQVNTLKKIIHRQEQKLATKEDEMKELEKALDDKETEIEVYLDELVKIDSEYKVKEENLARKHKEHVINVASEVKAKQGELDDVQVRLTEMENQLAAKDEELILMSGKMNDVLRGKFNLPEAVRQIKQLNTDIRKRDDQISKLIHRTNELDTKLSDLDDENTALRERSGLLKEEPVDTSDIKLKRQVEMNKLQALNSELLGQVDSLERERLELKDEVRLMAVRRGEAAVSWGMNVDQMQVVEEFAERVRCGEVDIRAFLLGRKGGLTAQREINEMKLNLEKLRQQLATAELERDDLKGRLESMKAEDRQSTASGSPVKGRRHWGDEEDADLVEENEKLLDENMQLTEQVRKGEREIETLQFNVEQLERDGDDAVKEIEDQRKEIEELLGLTKEMYFSEDPADSSETKAKKERGRALIVERLEHHRNMVEGKISFATEDRKRLLKENEQLNLQLEQARKQMSQKDGDLSGLFRRVGMRRGGPGSPGNLSQSVSSDNIAGQQGMAPGFMWPDGEDMPKLADFNRTLQDSLNRANKDLEILEKKCAELTTERDQLQSQNNELIMQVRRGATIPVLEDLERCNKDDVANLIAQLVHALDELEKKDKLMRALEEDLDKYKSSFSKAMDQQQVLYKDFVKTRGVHKGEVDKLKKENKFMWLELKELREVHREFNKDLAAPAASGNPDDMFGDMMDEDAGVQSAVRPPRSGSNDGSGDDMFGDMVDEDAGVQSAVAVPQIEVAGSGSEAAKRLAVDKALAQTEKAEMARELEALREEAGTLRTENKKLAETSAEIEKHLKEKLLRLQKRYDEANVRIAAVQRQLDDSCPGRELENLRRKHQQVLLRNKEVTERLTEQGAHLVTAEALRYQLEDIRAKVEFMDEYDAIMESGPDEEGKMTRELRQSEAKVKLLTRKLKANEQATAELEREVTELTDKTHDAITRMQEAEEKAVDAKNALAGRLTIEEGDKLKVLTSELEERLTKSEKQAERYRQEIDNGLRDWQIIEQEHKQLDAENKTLREELAQFRNSTEANARIARLTKELLDIKMRQTDDDQALSRALMTNNSLMQNALNLEDRIGRLEDALFDLREDMRHERENSRERVHDLKCKIAINVRPDKLDRLNDMVAAARHEQHNIRETMDSLIDQRTKAETELEAAEVELSSLKAALDQLNKGFKPGSAEAKFVSMNEQMKNTRLAELKLERALDAQKQKEDFMAKNLEADEERIKKLEEILVEAENDALRRENDLQGRVDRLEGEFCDRMAKENELLKQARERIRRPNMSAGLSAVDQTYDGLTAAHDNEEKLAAVTMQLHRMERENEDLQADIKNLRSQKMVDGVMITRLQTKVKLLDPDASDDDDMFQLDEDAGVQSMFSKKNKDDKKSAKKSKGKKDETPGDVSQLRLALKHQDENVQVLEKQLVIKDKQIAHLEELREEDMKEAKKTEDALRKQLRAAEDDADLFASKNKNAALTSMLGVDLAPSNKAEEKLAINLKLKLAKAVQERDENARVIEDQKSEIANLVQEVQDARYNAPRANAEALKRQTKALRQKLSTATDTLKRYEKSIAELKIKLEEKAADAAVNNGRFRDPSSTSIGADATNKSVPGTVDGDGNPEVERQLREDCKKLNDQIKAFEEVVRRSKKAREDSKRDVANAREQVSHKQAEIDKLMEKNHTLMRTNQGLRDDLKRTQAKLDRAKDEVAGNDGKKPPTPRGARPQSARLPARRDSRDHPSRPGPADDDFDPYRIDDDDGAMAVAGSDGGRSPKEKDSAHKMWVENKKLTQHNAKLKDIIHAQKAKFDKEISSLRAQAGLPADAPKEGPSSSKAAPSPAKDDKASPEKKIPASKSAVSLDAAQTIKSLHDQVAQASRSRDEFEAKYRASRNGEAQMQMQMEHYKRKYELMQIRIEDMEPTRDSHNGRADNDYKAQLIEVTSALHEHKEKAADLQNELAVNKAYLATEQATNQRIRKQLDDMNVLWSQLGGSANAASRVATGAGPAESGSDKETMMATIDKLNRVVRDLKSKNDVLKSGSNMNTKYMDLLRENKSLKKKCKDAEEQVEKLQGKESEMRKAIATAKALEDANETLRKRLKKDTESSDRLRQAVVDLTAGKEKLQQELTLASGGKVSTAKAAQRSAVDGAMQSMHEKVEGMAADLKRKDGLLVEMKNHIEKLDNENEDLRTKLDQRAEEVDMLHGMSVSRNEVAINKIADELKRLRLQYRDLEAERDDLKAQVRGISGSKDSSKESSAIRTSQSTDLGRQYNELLGAYNRILKERDRLREQNKGLLSELRAFDNEFFDDIEDLKYNYSEALKTIAKQQKQMDDYSKKFDFKYTPVSVPSPDNARRPPKQAFA